MRSIQTHNFKDTPHLPTIPDPNITTSVIVVGIHVLLGGSAISYPLFHVGQEPPFNSSALPHLRVNVRFFPSAGLPVLPPHTRTCHRNRVTSKRSVVQSRSTTRISNQEPRAQHANNHSLKPSPHPAPHARPAAAPASPSAVSRSPLSQTRP